MDKPIDLETYLLYAFELIIAILVSYFLLRWIFSINRILYRMKANNELLAEIAKKQGVDEKIVAGIMDKYES